MPHGLPYLGGISMKFLFENGQELGNFMDIGLQASLHSAILHWSLEANNHLKRSF